MNQSEKASTKRGTALAGYRVIRDRCWSTPQRDFFVSDFAMIVSDPAAGTNEDSVPSSHFTRTSEPRVAVTTPERGGVPIVSDSTTMRSLILTVSPS